MVTGQQIIQNAYSLEKLQKMRKISNLFVVKINDNYNLRNNGIDYTQEKPRTSFLKKASVIVVQNVE